MTTTRPRLLVRAAAALSVLAAAIHVWVMPEHFAEWWDYGMFFLVIAVAQAGYAVLLLRGAPSSGLLWAGILGNLAIIVL